MSDKLAVMPRHVPMIHRVQRTVEIPQCRSWTELLLDQSHSFIIAAETETLRDFQEELYYTEILECQLSPPWTGRVSSSLGWTLLVHHVLGSPRTRGAGVAHRHDHLSSGAQLTCRVCVMGSWTVRGSSDGLSLPILCDVT